MPRRKAVDGAPPAPKAPRSRKKKVNPEENKPPDAYDPSMMHPNGYMDGPPPHGMEGSAGGYGPPYGDYGAAPPYHPSYGAPPPFGSPEPANSPYIMPQQSNTPQPQMIMRPMPPPQQHTPNQLGPAPSALEFRIHEMNRRLYIFSSTGISESDHQQWWDAFSHEFFDDDCKLWFVIGDDATPIQEREKYCVGRNTVPRFFRSIFDSGMRELLYVLRGPSRECQSPGGFPAYENESVLQVTKFDSPAHTEINTECRLYVEFTPYDEVLNYRIRAWTLEMKQCDEFIYSDIKQEYERIDGGNPDRRQSTKMGFFKNTVSLMSLARILEPMQMIMSSAKSNGISWGSDPRDLMKRTLFYHYNETQRKNAEAVRQQMSAPTMIMPPAEPEKPKPVRKRQRKPAANAKAKKTAAANAAAAAAANASPAPSAQQYQPNPMAQSFSAMGYQDVMVVGEPSMMGGDFGDEDERTISRVENTQYDPNAIQMHQMNQGPPPQQMNGPPGGMGGPMGPPQNQMGGGIMGQSIGGMPPPMTNQMVPPMHQMPMNAAMLGGGVPMPNGMPNQMPNGMQPGYSFQPQQQWQQPPNSAMITG